MIDYDALNLIIAVIRLSIEFFRLFRDIKRQR